MRLLCAFSVGCCLALPLIAVAQVDSESMMPRVHVYAFDQPEVLSAQRVFGVGHAVTMLGESCADDSAASQSYAQWRENNEGMLQRLTTQLLTYYKMDPAATDPQRRIAETMHLPTQLNLSGSALTEACASLPQTLALPQMNLAQRYQQTLLEVRDPDYLKRAFAHHPKNPTAAPNSAEGLPAGDNAGVPNNAEQLPAKAAE